MSAERERVVAALIDLIATCKDGEAGYRSAAGHMAIPEIRQFLLGCAVRRRRFAEDLQSQVRRFGGEVCVRGTAKAAAHRRLIELRAAFALDDTDAILSECERGERAAVRHYEAALGHRLPAEVEEAVLGQRAQVIGSLAWLGSLRGR